ncbi:MAG: hypothetical protein M3Y87_03945 [Myxococcota bacterium]|nr:hypothetical protein [Myxococcota bacterium]
MRPALVLLVLLFSAGCSCGGSHERDGGAAEDGALSVDGALGDGSIADDAEVDGGTIDPATCEGYARALCGLYEGCYAEIIYVLGSRERCEALFRASCEHEDTLERTGDLTAARVAFVESSGTVDCGWANDDPWSPVSAPPGLGAEGDPCRRSLQCGEAIAADGRSVRMHCRLPSELRREPSCDVGVCEVPLAEGTPDCVGALGDDRCDVGLGLECGYPSADDSTPRCIPRTRHADGDPCVRFRIAPPECEDGSVCGPTSVCERRRFNGEGCDPDTLQHCAGGHQVACDAESRTCVLLDLALEGEPCGPPGETICGGLQDCVDGTCVRREGFRIRGEACELSTQCWLPLTCVDEVCGDAACE